MSSINATTDTALVVGASRGLGRGIAVELAEAGFEVVAVARTAPALAELAADSGRITSEPADAADPAVPRRLLHRHQPKVVIVVAGAAPIIAPLQEQTWETFSVNWQADVRIAFEWVREALLTPLAPGSRVVVISSGAAVAGSPLSGGYAGAKASQRFITAYGRAEAERSGRDLTFAAVLPKLTPMTDLGRVAVQAYAARAGQTVQEYTRRLGEAVTPRSAGAAVLELVRAESGAVAPAYLLTGHGLQELR